jgi:hypothetical protein
VQSKGTPSGAYLAHPSIKAEAKTGKQVHDSFFSNFYLLRLALHLDTPSFTSHPMVNQVMKHPMEELLEVVPACPCFHAML